MCAVSVCECAFCCVGRERMNMSSALSRIIIDLHLDIFTGNNAVLGALTGLRIGRAHVHLCLFIFSRVLRTHTHTSTLICIYYIVNRQLASH